VTVNDLLKAMNNALGGSTTYNLGNLTNLAGSIIAAYDGGNNPCITTTCSGTAPLRKEKEASPLSTAKGITEKVDFKVFPVPSDGVIHLDMQDYIGENVAIKVFNSMGQIVHTKETSECAQNVLDMDLSNLANGTYIISVQSVLSTPVSKVLIINR
jgi:hypothetical protein